jgi:glycosyltransferase involved in cell wall biosynthesis
MTPTRLRPRVLAVCSFFPVPADRGDPVRVGMFLRSLNVFTDLTVYVVRRSDTNDGHLQDLRAQLPRATVTAFDAAAVGRSRLATVRRWLRAARTRTPAWVINRFSPQLAGAIRASAREFDAVVLLGDASGAYAVDVRGLPVHLDKANVLSRSSAQDVEAAGYWSKPRLAGIARLSRSFERRLLSQVNSISVTSQEEATRLFEDYGRRADFVLPSAIDLADETPPFKVGTKYIVWLGSLDYRSNLTGLERYLTHGLPGLAIAGLTLLVAGSGADVRLVRRLERTPGVEYRGFVPDLTCLVADARAAVVPLWTGAGVKLKTLTLMSLGLPVVATPVAMEGIATEAALAVRDDPAELSAMLVDASDHDLWAARSRAFGVLRRDFSAETFTAAVGALTQSFGVAAGT